MIVRVGGAWEDVSSALVQVNGQFKQVTEIRARASGAWETVATFAQDLSVSQSPSAISGTRSGSGLVTTNAVTITPTGGEAPFTYSSVPTGGASGFPNSPSSATSTFTRSLTNGEQVTETFRWTVTDSFGASKAIDVTVTFTSNFTGGGG